MEQIIEEKRIDMNNNESLIVRGIYLENGIYTALTATRSREFKTLKGAQRWLNGNR